VDGVRVADMASDGTDRERVRVRTYVPAYQKTEWKDHADELGMSQSEFVRTMVQAGRSGFEPVVSETVTDSSESNPVEAGPSGTNPGGNDLKDRLQELLAGGDYYDWDELVAELTADIEQRLDDALQELQSEGTVRYSGRRGGYTLDE